MNNLQQRILSSFVLGSLFILLLCWDKTSLFAVMLLIMSLIQVELGRLEQTGKNWLFVCTGLLLYALSYWGALQIDLHQFVWIILFFATLNTIFVFRFLFHQKATRSLLPASLYVGISISSIHYFQFVKEPHYIGIILFLSLLWASDVGAYFIGKRFGRRKLLPSLSPNKTVEGLWGGLALNLLVCLIIMIIWDISPFILLLGILVHFYSVGGDLFESKLKRFAKVKDSGRLIPGHGGMFDRFDGLLFALPPAIVFYHFLLSCS